MKTLLIILTIVLQLILLSYCGRKDDYYIEEKIAKKMVLFYISGNNDLRNEAFSTIKKIQKGIKEIDGSVIVYVKTDKHNSYLLKVYYSLEERIISDTLKTYQNTNSSDPNFLQKVIADSRSFAPADSYGLILWSHATSWLPKAKAVNTKSFGNDNGFEMDLLDLKQALPNDLDFILFDACYMGSIEVMYELRKKARYFISSPAEVLASGFPYQDCTADLFAGEEGLKRVCESFFNYYQTKKGPFASATISLIDAKKLNLVSAGMKQIIEDNNKLQINISGVQKLNFQNGSDLLSSYDLLDLISKNYPTKKLYDLERSLENVVIYKANTNFFLNQKIYTYSGLSVFGGKKTKKIYLDAYEKLEWNKDTNWINYFKTT